MKRLIFLLPCLIALQALAQLPLTLEEAVLGQGRQFAPERLSQLNWLPYSDQYVFVRKDTLFLNLIKDKQSALLTLPQLNELTESIGKSEAMPMLTWIDAARAWFMIGDDYVELDLKTKRADRKNSQPSGAANADYHALSRNLAWTVDNNLFVSSLGKTTQVTNNAPGIVSGQSISRNEYGIGKGTFWSPDGSALAFYQKDETMVTDYPLVNYKEVPARLNNIKYPMAGSRSEIVSVGVYHTASGKTLFLDLTEGRAATDDFYATNVSWSPDSKKIYVIRLNRATTEMKLMEFDAGSGQFLRAILTEKDDRWVEPSQPITFVPGRTDQFFWYSWRDGYHNYYLYNTNGELLGQTKAAFELTAILGFDASGTTVFFEGTGENPTELHAFSASVKDLTLTRITPAAGTHRVQVSGTGKFILDTYSSLTVPNRTDLTSSGGRMVRNLLTAKNPLEGRMTGITEVFTIKASDGTDLYCRVIKPSGFQPGKQYPSVVYVYNGPHVQLVTNSWLGGASLWMNYLAEKGYIVFTVDGRGSAHRGKAFEQCIHRQLGTLEIEDQAAGSAWLRSQKWIDQNRMAIHGWSFGGFMTTSMMLRMPGTFKVGVAGGPVIDWRLYEVMYTERYMDTPQENPDGYKTADLTNYVDQLRGKLLMIHGTDDDVVVMQHNMNFLKACIDKKVQVDFFAYPGHAHNVRGKDRVHLIQKVIEYIEGNL